MIWEKVHDFVISMHFCLMLLNELNRDVGQPTRCNLPIRFCNGHHGVYRRRILVIIKMLYSMVLWPGGFSKADYWSSRIDSNFSWTLYLSASFGLNNTILDRKCLLPIHLQQPIQDYGDVCSDLCVRREDIHINLLLWLLPDFEGVRRSSSCISLVLS